MSIKDQMCLRKKQTFRVRSRSRGHTPVTQVLRESVSESLRGLTEAAELQDQVSVGWERRSGVGISSLDAPSTPVSG